MATFTYWFGLVLVLIVVAIGVKEIVGGLRNKEHDAKGLRQVAVFLVVGLIVVFVPPLQLLNRAVWRGAFRHIQRHRHTPESGLMREDVLPQWHDGIPNASAGGTRDLAGGGANTRRGPDSCALLAPSSSRRRLRLRALRQNWPESGPDLRAIGGSLTLLGHGHT